MSLALSSLRCHFVKHLTSCNSATTFFSFRRRCIKYLPPRNWFSSFPSPKAAQQQQQPSSWLNIATVNYSTHPLRNGSTVTDDSFTSPYLSVRICCPRHVVDVLSESLLCFGASSTTVDEQDTHETDEEIWISSTFDVDQDVKDCISRAADSIGLKERPNYKVEMHDHTDWIKQTQESFHPVEIKEGLWIVPEWRSPSTVSIAAASINKRRRILSDYGTGSGVLAIAALKFGADLSVGFDIEPQAITSARHNASLNNIGPDKLLLSLVPSKNGLNSRVNVHWRTSALTIHTIQRSLVPTVMKHYSQFLEDINVSMMDDWACISGTKKTELSTLKTVF
ncbi:hypothetical protein DH2020_031727 [Rehmannia glutinosa]|uniref:ETFB lysine methyltransferase n=1 Tax=Rehmannia glutinosa TaxID=99300 RepID=A0ABR0VI27_REHGL